MTIFTLLANTWLALAPITVTLSFTFVTLLTFIAVWKMIVDYIKDNETTSASAFAFTKSFVPEKFTTAFTSNYISNITDKLGNALAWWWFGSILLVCSALVWPITVPIVIIVGLVKGARYCFRTKTYLDAHRHNESGEVKYKHYD